MADAFVASPDNGKGPMGGCVCGSDAAYGRDGMDKESGNCCFTKRSALHLVTSASLACVFDLPPCLRAVDDLSWSPFLASFEP